MSTVMITPGSATDVDHRRGGIEGGRLIDHGRGYPAERVDVDLYARICERCGRKCQGSTDNNRNALFHD
jgi:hypothetical protein